MKEKYAKITFTILMSIPLLLSLFFLDQYVLPQKQLNDKIIAYQRVKIKAKRSVEFVGYKFFTEKGYEFSIGKEFIEENDIVVKRSYIFQSVTSVKSAFKNYSYTLISALHGACLYFILSVIVTVTISLALLRFDKTLSENGFQNIVLINSLLLIITCYVFSLYN